MLVFRMSKIHVLIEVGVLVGLQTSDGLLEGVWACWDGLLPLLHHRSTSGNEGQLRLGGI